MTLELAIFPLTSWDCTGLVLPEVMVFIHGKVQPASESHPWLKLQPVVMISHLLNAQKGEWKFMLKLLQVYGFWEHKSSNTMRRFSNRCCWGQTAKSLWGLKGSSYTPARWLCVRNRNWQQVKPATIKQSVKGGEGSLCHIWEENRYFGCQVTRGENKLLCWMCTM